MSSYKLVNTLTAGVEQTLQTIRRLQCRQAAVIVPSIVSYGSKLPESFQLMMKCITTCEDDYFKTYDFVEDSYDYDNDADYISSEESDIDCKDTVNIYVEESLNVIQGDGDKEQKPYT
ncbi:hypothetical protein DPMN_050385 [Dreissena polymorpha]|uniref:Uncharacterized protein n=1 Tax=Dreissena polymorpha TaxID=45954 RepID=A0A9D4CHR4_DREPO|nr:hypothetical protein DPMN_050385 [Dreissena polymorpha]